LTGHTRPHASILVVAAIAMMSAACASSEPTSSGASSNVTSATVRDEGPPTDVGHVHGLQEAKEISVSSVPIAWLCDLWVST
jgi:hypothetical protein